MKHYTIKIKPSTKNRDFLDFKIKGTKITNSQETIEFKFPIPYPLPSFLREDMIRAGRNGWSIAKGLLAIPGILNVYISEDTISVVKDPAFGWGKIAREAIKVISRTIGVNFSVVGLEKYPEKEEKDKILVTEYVQNPRIRSFHPGKRLSNVSAAMSDQAGTIVSTRRIGKVGQRILSETIEVGLGFIGKIFLYPYSVQVELSPQYDSYHARYIVEPQIRYILKKTLFEKTDRVSVRRIKKRG